MYIQSDCTDYPERALRYATVQRKQIDERLQQFSNPAFSQSLHRNSTVTAIASDHVQYFTIRRRGDADRFTGHRRTEYAREHVISVVRERRSDRTKECHIIHLSYPPI